MGVINLTGVHKFFEDVHVIKGVDLEIGEGEFVVFVGPSGCGKSTMLRLIAGLEEATSGRIEIEGRDVTSFGASERGLAMVFQSYALYPHMSVRENLGFGLKMAGAPRADRDAAVGDAAEILQLAALLDRKPRELSGGQRQRVAIGRAIVRNPAAFLFDEPLSNLDAALRVQMRIELARLHKRLGKTMVYVTHDQVEAMTLADRIIVFNDGVVQQQGKPLELYRNPASLFVATFIGSPKMNVIPCQADGAGVRLANGTRIEKLGHVPPGAAHMGIRPEHISVVSSRSSDLRGTVAVAEHLGSDSFLYVSVPGLDLVTVRCRDGEGFAEGVEVGLALDRGSLHFFDS